MKLFKIIFIIFITVKLSAIVVNYSDLPKDIQRAVIPDMEGKVLLNDLDTQLIENASFERELPQVAEGWPVSYTGSNCHNGAIYVNMDSDPESEILFGVGTKITALNLDGTTVEGWPVQLAFYIWSSPAAGDIDGDGEIEIVCTSRDNTTANSGALYAFELDGTACTGFPVTQAGGGTNNACLYDLDSDGDMEILVNVRNHPQGWVYVYNGDGSVYEGFPQELDYIPGAGISVGDITGDGIPEIVALSYNMLHVFDLQGNILPGFPVENTGYTYSYSQPIIYDLDDDGLREIIWGGCSGSVGAVFAVNQDASSVDGWPQTTNYWIFGTVSIGDVDQDGSLDVVIGDQVGSGTPVDQIFAWDSSGNAITGFPAGPTNAIYSQIGIADLDGDGNVELMIDDNNFGFGYNAYNHDGTQCEDWPLACGTIWSSTTMGITPVFGDVDNDNELEIMGAATDIMNWVVECYLWDTDAVWNEDLAYMIIDGVNIQHNGLYDPSAFTYNPPLNVQVDEETVTLSWEPPVPSSSVLTGYNIYLDGILDGTVNVDVTEYMYTGLIPETVYTAGVSAVYDDSGESEIIEVIFQMAWYVPFLPPINPEATVEDYNDVLVTWDLPGGPYIETIQHHSGYDNNGIGTGAAFEAEVVYDSRREAPAQQSSSRVLAGYTVYRDGVEIVEIDDPAILSYLDESLDAGTYEYTITAFYINPPGESEPTDPVIAEVILNPPVNLNAWSQPPNIILTWDAPNRGIDSYNVYRDGILLAEEITGLVYIDINVPTGTYIYNVTAVYDGGWESEFSNDAGWVQETDHNLMPLVTDLNGNYPNPFNPETTISFDIAEGTTGTLSIYSIKGQLIEAHEFNSGHHDHIWNATDQSSGIYLYKLETGSLSKTRKMLLLK